MYYFVLVDQCQNQITNERDKAVKCLEKQANKMMTLSNKKFQQLEVDTTVRVPILDVDRARGSPRNILAVIVSIDNYYELCKSNKFTILIHVYLNW